LVILLLFVGLAIDFGMAFVTKARLGKAADAAALTGARYSAQGVEPATTMAQSAFAMNYGGLTAPPAVAFSTDANGNTLVNVTASTSINTSFIRLLPGYSTLNVTSVAQSMARRVEMTIVLDNSGSMATDGGKQNLPTAVEDFIKYFDDQYDSVALVTFSTLATNVFPMTQGNFQSSIIYAAKHMKFTGHTFSDAALQFAFTQELQPVTGNLSKVVVFFTDGGANTIQNSLTCGANSKLASQIWNFGGDDPNGPGQTPAPTAVGFMDPTTGTDQKCSMSDTNCCSGATFPSAALNKSVVPAWSKTGAATTPWSTGAIQVPLTYSYVQNDALYRAVGDAIGMRRQGITVYSIGLGSAPSPADPQFLCQIANDPSCSSTYDPTLPAGVYVGAATGGDLDAAFQTIATIIRLRLTQ
jgi:Flp pilus assembly protein TadG